MFDEVDLLHLFNGLGYPVFIQCDKGEWFIRVPNKAINGITIIGHGWSLKDAFVGALSLVMRSYDQCLSASGEELRDKFITQLPDRNSLDDFRAFDGFYRKHFEEN